jgi:predicted ester cyclase
VQATTSSRPPTEHTVQRRTLQSLRKLFCNGDLKIADELFDSDYVDHDPDGPSAARGPESARRTVSMYRSAFPDLRLAVEEQVVEGDTVVTRWKGRGTYLGRLLEEPPTGERVSLRGVTVTRFAHARAVEGWSNWEKPVASARAHGRRAQSGRSAAAS